MPKKKAKALLFLGDGSAVPLKGLPRPGSCPLCDAGIPKKKFIPVTLDIKLERVRGGWTADFACMPGAAEIGTGKTRHEAIACLFIRNRGKYMYYSPPGAVLTINNRKWRDLKGASRR